nr:MAG TPA: hypothetical protein [Caudoviricetes sp.]
MFFHVLKYAVGDCSLFSCNNANLLNYYSRSMLLLQLFQ